MKILSTLCCMSCMVAPATGGLASEVEAPEMNALGIRMIEFMARPGADEVAILRVEETHSEFGLETYDIISYRPPDPVVGHVLLQDLGKVYADQKGNWGISYGSGGGIRSGFRYLDGKVAKNRAEFRFSAVEGGKPVVYDFRFSVMVMSYQKAKALHPKLTDMGADPWTFCGMLNVHQAKPAPPRKAAPDLNKTT